MKRYLGFFPLLLVCTLFISGCGGGSGGTDTSAEPWLGTWKMTKSQTGGAPVPGYSATLTFNSNGTSSMVIIFSTIGLDCTRTGSYSVNSNLEYTMTITGNTGCELIENQHTDETGRFEFTNGNNTMTIYPNGLSWSEWDRIS